MLTFKSRCHDVPGVAVDGVVHQPDSDSHSHAHPVEPPPDLLLSSCVLQVTGTMGSMKSGLHQHLARLDEIFATRGDYVQTLQFMQQMADNVIKQLLGLPDWAQAKVDLAVVADQIANVEYYR